MPLKKKLTRKTPPGNKKGVISKKRPAHAPAACTVNGDAFPASRHSFEANAIEQPMPRTNGTYT